MPNRQSETRGGRDLVTMPAKRPSGAVALPVELLPPIILAAGEKASRRFLEFFAASIRNPNTRKAYIHAWPSNKSSRWLFVASYIEKHPATAKPEGFAQVKQKRAASRSPPPCATV